MIFIIDNGYSYSDHIIFFVNAHSDFRLEFCFLPWSELEGEGEAESLIWRNKKMFAIEFFHEWNKNSLPMLPDSILNTEIR